MRPLPRQSPVTFLHHPVKTIPVDHEDISGNNPQSDWSATHSLIMQQSYLSLRRGSVAEFWANVSNVPQIHGPTSNGDHRASLACRATMHVR